MIKDNNPRPHDATLASFEGDARDQPRVLNINRVEAVA
jgi:hypothetical protein